MDITQWIRSRAATGQPLNLHAVARERPDLLELAFAGPTPRGWRRSLMDAGVDPYKIVHEYEKDVQCAVCGISLAVIGTHLQICHDMTGEEYRREFGADRETSSESFRASHFGGRPIAGIAHWEQLWSRHYVIDWILRLHDEGHDLNFQNLVNVGRPLTAGGLLHFGSWDAALRAAGLNPDLLRHDPPGRQWTRQLVIDSLRDFAKLKKENRRRQMSISLDMAIRRYFPTRQAACLAAGLKYEEITLARFKDEAVVKLVAAIRALEGLKGRERRLKLDAIYYHDGNQQLVLDHYGSLQVLAAREGIAPRAVSRAMYRDEADVQHDLDVLEREGSSLTPDSLKNGALYRAITANGWGTERLTAKVRQPTLYPPCNPHSGQLRDRMILLRRRLRICTDAAAGKTGISRKTWANIENGQVKARETSVEKIERLLEEHQIHVSAAL